MFIEQIIEYELRGAGPPERTCSLITVYLIIIFMTNQKSLKENLIVDYSLQLKYCRRQCILLLPTWAESLTKFSTKMQDLKRVLD